MVYRPSREALGWLDNVRCLECQWVRLESLSLEHTHMLNRKESSQELFLNRESNPTANNPQGFCHQVLDLLVFLSPGSRE